VGVIQLPVFNTNILDIGFIQIRWYSLAYIFGIILAWFLVKYFNGKYELQLFKNENNFSDDFFFYGIVGIILGGRIVYVLFYDFMYFFKNPGDIFAVWKGGMSFHGGFIGVIVACILICKKYRIRILLFGDVLAVATPIALFLGRIANFINLELYGRPTNGKWGMIFPTADNLPRHPSQLYEAFFEGLLLFLIILFFVKKYKFQKIGLNTIVFLECYGFFRFFIEYFREPDEQLGYIFKYMTMGQLLSLPIILLGVGIFICNRKKVKNTNAIQSNT
jgi:phosphatidylglycerol:prolipoprotein diacylglycerol transferase